MRIIPVELEIMYRDTLLLSVLHLDGDDIDTCLLEIGWWCGEWKLEMVFSWFIRWRIIEPILERFR